MKKRLFALLMVLVLCACTVIPAFAAEGKTPWVQDHAQLLTQEQAQILTEKLESIGSKYSVTLAVVTVESCDGKDHEDYAKSVYGRYGYGDDGILLLIDMDEENRGWYIFGKGIGYDAIDDGESDAIGETITPFLTDAEYTHAFHTFADECEPRLDVAVNGEPFKVIRSLVISLVIGMGLALAITGGMKGKLKSVRSQRAATNYVRQGSMNITESYELFLYKTVERKEKPKSSSGSSGSSGSRQGGSGGSF